MIDLLHYGIGFIIYVGFCVITYNTYSQKKGETNQKALFMIYLYYTILAGYLINLVDGYSTINERFIQIAIYAIGAGFFLYLHFDKEEEILDKMSF